MIKLFDKYPQHVDAALLVFGFTMGTNLFIFFKLVGIDEGTVDQLLTAHGFHWMVPTIAGLVIGTSFVIIENTLFDHFPKSLSRVWVLTIKIGTFAVVILCSSVLVQSAIRASMQGETVEGAITSALDFLQTPMFFSLFIYLMLLGLTLNFFREVGNRFGHGILWNFILGKYRQPVEEDRVFMFLDLNNSTGIAEKLGHVKYSRFINKCFSDLLEVLDRYQGEIYQYVGDEAIVTWRKNELKDNSGVFELYYSFCDFLESNRGLYEEKFGVFPSFKASVHGGKVVVSELGNRKKELAYHGDVLNTASRLLGLCKKYGYQLITTKAFLENYLKTDGYHAHHLTTVKLRGKSDEVWVYGLAKG